jgi:tetratricopeptide (TPR) repeat protein
MMKKTAKLITLTVSLFLVLANLNLNAQSLDEAGMLFNQGVEQMKAEDFNQAITSFEATVAICDQLGPEGAELKARAVQQIPDLHYRLGLALYKEKKIAESIIRLEQAVEISKELGDENTQAKAQKILPQLIYAVGMSEYKKDNFDAALEKMNAALAYDESYAKAYLGKALILNKQDNAEEMQDNLQKAIRFGEAEGDSKTIASAQEIGYKGFLVRGQKALQANQLADAESYLSKAASYNDSEANLHYLLAVTYNKLQKFELARDEAAKAVELEESPEKQAAAWFELGTAYEKLGDNGNACDAYAKALTGPNGAAAKYQRDEVLKCP